MTTSKTKPCGYCKKDMVNPRVGKKYCTKICANRQYTANRPSASVPGRPRKTAQTFLDAWALWSPEQKLMQSALSSYPIHKIVGR